MRAVVMSCKAYAPFAAHMIQGYQRLWPDHPFVFRVPFELADIPLPPDLHSRIEPRPFPGNPERPPIRETVLTLLQDLPDDEWIFWCLDDKYPITLDLDLLQRVHDWITQSDPDVAGVAFCRCRDLLAERNLFPGTTQTPWGTPLRRRRTYHQIWIHQFIRVAVIRQMFLRFPQRPYRAVEMDPISWMLRVPDDQTLLVTQQNTAIFGESTSHGAITQNCLESMRAAGVPSPPNFRVTRARILVGKFETDDPAELRRRRLARLRRRVRQRIRSLPGTVRSGIRLLTGGADPDSAAARLRDSDVFLAAYPCSGSTWMRAIVTYLLYPPEAVQILADLRHLVPDVDVGIPDNPDYSAPRVVATRQPFDQRPGAERPELYRRVIHLVRRPLEVAASLQSSQAALGATTTFAETLCGLAEGAEGRASWPRHTMSWLDAAPGRGVLLIRFEDLCTDGGAAIRRVAQFLGRSPTDEQVAAITALTSREALSCLERRGRLDERIAFATGGNSVSTPTGETSAPLPSSVEQTMARLGYRA